MAFKDLSQKDKDTIRGIFAKLDFPLDDDDSKVTGFFCTRKDMNRLPEQELPKPKKPETLKEKLKRISKP